MMIFTGTIFLLISLDTALGVFYHYKTVTMSSKEEVIKSPGYPHKNYERNTNYTWYVIASDDTEEISIEITTDIYQALGFPCDDYLQIKEIKYLATNFFLFKRCGLHKSIITAIGNGLLISLISNDDKLTSKGFQLKLKVAKVGTILTTRNISTQSTTTKTRTTASSEKTAVSKARSTKSTLTKRTIPTSTLLPSTVEPLKASTAEVLMSNTTMTNTTTQSTTSTTPPTTRKMITTTPIVTSTTLLTKSRTLLTSTETASKIRTTDGNESNKESTTIWLPSSQSVETRSTSYQKSSSNTQSQPKQSSTSGTRNITTTMDTVTDTTTSSSISGNSLEMKTVSLLIGLGVLEVTLIVVGVLAAQRYRRKRNSNPSRHASKRIDDDANTLKRQNSCGETNVYDEINIDDVKEEKEENPYKELPEGVYDTTLKRRSYLKVVGGRKSNYSRGSIINMFRTSSFFKKKVNETSVMTFSSFKGPIQSQIGEKSNQ